MFLILVHAYIHIFGRFIVSGRHSMCSVRVDTRDIWHTYLTAIIVALWHNRNLYWLAVAFFSLYINTYERCNYCLVLSVICVPLLQISTKISRWDIHFKSSFIWVILSQIDYELKVLIGWYFSTQTFSQEVLTDTSKMSFCQVKIIFFRQKIHPEHTLLVHRANYCSSTA